jgi:NAD(P)-dependent dehydrogenase (short-subunit alcohol dehydrogenase family)
VAQISEYEQPVSTREFDGRVALVTGGASGIGLAICRRLCNGGAAVAVADRDAPATAKAVAELQAAGGNAIATVCDVSGDDSVRSAVDAAVHSFGALHLAVNNAGISGRRGKLAETTIEDYRAVTSVNLDGVFHCLRHQIPAMLATGGGAIVNVASVLGSHGFPGLGPYVAAKHGVVGLTRTAALEYADEGIRVNAIGPGFIDTPMLSGATEPERALLSSLHPAGRLGTAEDVAELAAFLLSDRAAFITGSYHLVDGGYAAR